ncbi:uncharacterized protein LOC106662701 [Cimex lectularius]|uniref:Uncharacterized protein n=1 Tax=Cimex lectularius TaxID=79782 RepID=A0A8I6TMN1_CIMLE|nr:uncharacterized protein LOC106662701 [Cimex lectularius]XP_024084592.1 uncharacterized protein LOC106662701 [Cimex lectularius]
MAEHYRKNASTIPSKNYKMDLPYGGRYLRPRGLIPLDLPDDSRDPKLFVDAYIETNGSLFSPDDLLKMEWDVEQYVGFLLQTTDADDGETAEDDSALEHRSDDECDPASEDGYHELMQKFKTCQEIRFRNERLPDIQTEVKRERRSRRAAKVCRLPVQEYKSVLEKFNFMLSDEEIAHDLAIVKNALDETEEEDQ